MRWLFLGSEDHVSRFFAAATAFFDVKSEIVLQNVIPPRMAKLLSGDPAWRDLTALRYHYETQPLPTWTSWYLPTME